MTETVGARSSARKGAPKGIKIERIFTTPGVHPYDEVTWESRDVVQTNWKTGETIFRAARCRVPRLLVAERVDHRDDQVLPWRRRHPAAGEGLKQLVDRVVLNPHQGGQGQRLLRV